ncbi:uncharacterized protein MEPE_02064 [Melanopsichium pennsylvanicum]|uniref:Effector family protein Eff1 n=1 Tax=Melanopsichium pennsylvanicum TaxID=63383 RepID=A0AAJ5C480_9BASI|nr:uncharacterized protein MEPE_02064 [Melanopsichium pennsylvanicum]
MTGAYRLVLVLLVVLAVSRVCHSMDDHIWNQLENLPEAAREFSVWTNGFEESLHHQPTNHDPNHLHFLQDAPNYFQPGSDHSDHSVHLPSTYDPLGYSSGWHQGASSSASVPYETGHAPSSSFADQVAPIAESGWQPYPADDHIIGLDTATGLLNPPEPLNKEERIAILEPFARKTDKVNRYREIRKYSTLHPFLGKMTQQLAAEALGSEFVYLYHDSPSIYLVHGTRPQEYVLSHGAFESQLDPELDHTHNLHVWKRFAVPNTQGSVFQYVGMIETAKLAATAHRGTRAYNTPRDLTVLGQDSVYNPFPLYGGLSKLPG